MHPVRNDTVFCAETPDLGTRLPRTSMQWTALTLGLVLIPGQMDPRRGRLLELDRLRTTRRRHIGTDRDIPNFRWTCIWNRQSALKPRMEHLCANGLLAARIDIVYYVWVCPGRLVKTEKKTLALSCCTLELSARHMTPLVKHGTWKLLRRWLSVGRKLPGTTRWCRVCLRCAFLPYAHTTNRTVNASSTAN